MKRKLKGLLLSTAAFLAVSLFGGIATATSFTNQNNVEEAEAASHPANYDPYTYSGSYYNKISSTATEGMSGSLRTSLTSLIHPGSVPTYSSSGATHLSTVLQYADEDPTNSSNMIYLYTRDSVTKNAASSWNREHVWPQSLSNNCWGTGRAGADLLHLRPTYNTTNSTRGNLPYGNVTNGTTRTYNGITYGYTSSSYFMPLDSVKGDVARIIMYVWVAYYDEYGSKLPAITNVFQSFDVLMSWHVADQPDVMEGNRNDYAETTSMQKNRNPFVDHPEYAWKIFGSNCSSSVLAAAKAAYPGGQATNYCSISETSKTMSVGGTFNISATTSNGSQVTWSTSDSSVVSISSSTSASGASITLTANATGTATIYAQATISGTVYKSNCVVTVTNGGGGGGDTDDDTIIIYPSDFGTYTAGISKAGFTSSSVGQYSSSIQFASGDGVLYNTTALTNISTITINKTSGKNNLLTVYGSTTSGSMSNVISGTSVGNTYTYDFTSGSYPYFYLKNGKGATNLDSIVIEYGSGSGGTEEKTLESITVLDPKTSFNKGDTWTFGGSVIANYSDDDTLDVTSEATFSGYDMSTAGNQTVTVSYTEDDVTKTDTYSITVTDTGGGGGGSTTYTLLTSIASIDESAQYVLGVDGTGFHYSGTSGWGLVALPSAQTPLYYTLKKANNNTSFTAKTTIGNTVYYLQIPTTNTFSMATSTGTNTDIIIGTTAEVSDPDYAVANQSSSSRHIRINGSSGLRSYGGATGTMAYFYKVTTVVPTKTLSSISISNQKTSYYVGEEFIKPTVTAHFSDSSSDATIANDCSYSGYNMSTAGNYTVTVSYTYSGTTKTATYSISVSVDTLVSIAVSNQVTSYYVGDAFIKPTVTASYSSGALTDISNFATITGYNMSAAGNYTVTVSYTDGVTKTTTYSITVETNDLEFISISGYKTNFAINSSFSYGGSVTAEYSNGSSADVTAEATFSGYNMSTLGNQTVTVSYTEGGVTKTATYQITISNEIDHSYDVTIGGTAYYSKVTSTSNITDGQYLIVYETGNIAFDGSLDALDAVSNTINVSISSSTINATTAIDNSSFTIDTTAGTIQSASGYYIGCTSDSNTLNTSTETAYTNTLSISDGNFVCVGSGGSYLRYNNGDTQLRFRYYKAATYTQQQAIQLYKRVEEGGTVETKTITGITATCEETFYVGEYFDYSAIEITAYYQGGSFNPTQDINYSLSETYIFTYQDSGTGTSTKAITVSFAGWDETVSLTVSRKAYAHSTLSLTGSDFVAAGVINGNSSRTTGNLTVAGISMYVYKSYVYNGKLSFSDDKNNASGYVYNTSPVSRIYGITVNGASPDVAVSTDGSTWQDIGSVNLETTSYRYFKIYYSNSYVGSYVNISSINITCDTARSLADYIMYTDTSGQCTGASGKFKTASDIFDSLSLSDRNTFMTSNDYVIATARERFQAWARHEGKTINHVNDDYIVETGKTPFIVLSSDNNALILILTISSLLAVSFIGFALYRKKAKKS